MNKKEFLKKIKQQAKKDANYRKDQRYLKVMGFLVAKGFLYTNQNITMLPNARIDIDDAIWAGQKVEPRILEVLPAAVIRLKNHFNYNPDAHEELYKIINALNKNLPGNFFGIDIDKIKPWLNIKLKDGRTKKMTDKKVTKTFRLHPNTVLKLAEMKKNLGQSEAAIIENLVLSRK